MSYAGLIYVMDRIHHKRRAIIKDILNNHMICDTEYEHDLFHCEKCGKLYERFYVRIEYDDNEVYESVFKCKQCQTILRRVPEEDHRSLECPSCKQATLTTNEYLDWD
jgi:phage FluMu protein Com